MTKRKIQDTDITEHHLDPKSRGGSNKKENKKDCIWKIHRAFNVLFTNFYLKTSYVVTLLQEFGIERFLEYRRNKNKQGLKNAWQHLFNSCTCKDIIRILQTGGQQELRKQRGLKDVERFQKLWKKLFRISLKSDEIILLLKTYGPEAFLKNEKAEQAWEILEFDGLTDEKIIEKIKNKWSPKT